MMGRLYHYTSQAGHEQIVRSGVIKQSQNFTRDCVYGDGVYLTTLNPEDFSKEDLAKNNYGGGWRKRLSDGRLDYYVEIEIPFSDLTPMETGMRIATEGLRLDISPGISPHMAKLIKICMNEDPGKRPTFDQIIPILEKMRK